MNIVSKIKKITKKQLITTFIILLLLCVFFSSFLITIKSLVEFSLLLSFIYLSFKLYKSTPQQRFYWGKKYKILGFLFKDPNK